MSRLIPSRLVLLLVLASLVIGLLGARAVDGSQSWGWDESMHAGLPAARIGLDLEAGAPLDAAQVAVECQQYPFVYPALVGTASALVGDPARIERFGRQLGRWMLALLALGTGLLARELALGLFGGAGRDETPGVWLAALLALLLCRASPLLVDYSGTWFLEVPFAAVMSLTLLAWLRRARLAAEVGAWSRDLTAGALIALAFFTKFNYGLLLGAGLFLDVVVELVLVSVPACRSRAAWPSMGRLLGADLWLAALPLLSFAWWFLLPLPGGTELGDSHRAALMAFLGGNLELVRTSDGLRLLDWATAAFLSPRLLLLALLGVGASLVLAVRNRGLASLALVALAGSLPIALHNFHLDRFLVPPLASLLPLVAVGLSFLGLRLVRGHAALVLVPALVLAAALFPGLDGAWLFQKTRGFSPDPLVRAYQDDWLARRAQLGFDRPLSTGGLDATAAGRLLDLFAERVLAADQARSPEAGPVHIGYLGINSELSPAALHLGLLARGGSVERFLRDAARTRPDGKLEMIVTFEDLDPGWNDDQLRVWARNFELVFTTAPHDLRGRSNRRTFIQSYQERLIGSGIVEVEELGSVQVPRPLKAPQLVRLIALTPRQG